MARYQVKTVQPQAGALVQRAHATGEQGDVTFDFRAQLLPLVPGDVVRLALDHSLPYACNGTIVAQVPGQLLADLPGANVLVQVSCSGRPRQGMRAGRVQRAGARGSSRGSRAARRGAAHRPCELLVPGGTRCGGRVAGRP